MKTVLCYGDSNTWGYVPTTGARFAPEIRWTGVLQRELGPEYRVLEEGLNGRTSGCEDEWDPYLNGRAQLIPTLRIAAPLDLVILMLGTNDLKYHGAWGSAQACCELIRTIRQNADLFTDGKPRVLLVSPPLLGEPRTVFMADPEARYCTRAESEKFWPYYQQYAAFLDVPCFNAASVANPGPDGAPMRPEGICDGIHLDPAGHRALGAALAEQVRALF